MDSGRRRGECPYLVRESEGGIETVLYGERERIMHTNKHSISIVHNDYV